MSSHVLGILFVLVALVVSAFVVGGLVDFLLNRLLFKRRLKIGPEDKRDKHKTKDR